MRWPSDTAERLQRAALELFAEHGYTATTVPQITARAGLTTRTFFRHFADKREVIFGGTQIPDTAAALIRAAPRNLAPIAVIDQVLHQVASERFDGHRAETTAWRAVINANEELRDRDARKRADLVLAATAAFVDRGEEPLAAALYAETGALVFHVALDSWTTGPATHTMTQTASDVLRMISVNVGQPAVLERR